MTLDTLALPITGDRFRLERADDGISIIRLADEVSVGSFAVEDIPEGLLVRSLCIEEQHRSYGAGSEAARLFNRACEAAKVPMTRTWAHPNLGLSVYFWIRMGYRPLHGEGPDGGLWFERRNDNA